MLGECLLISRYQGKAEPGKFDIKRHEPVILLISLPIVSVVKLVINANYDLIIDFHIDSTSSTSFKMCNVMLT